MCRKNWGYFDLVWSVMAGCRIVSIERLRAAAVLKLIDQERISYVPASPAAIAALLDANELATHPMASLRMMLTGGASAAVETIKALQDAVSRAHLIRRFTTRSSASPGSRVRSRTSLERARRCD